MGASRLAQTNALLRKNLVLQRRACKTNTCIILFPVLLCSVLGGMQIATQVYYNRVVAVLPQPDCSCSKVSVDGNTVGGISCPSECAMPRAPKWPPQLQLPRAESRAVKDDLFPYTDLPDESCRETGSCPPAFLITGGNRSFASSLMDHMFPTHTSPNLSANLSTLADFVLATEFSMPSLLDLSFSSLVFLQDQCALNVTLSFPVQNGNRTYTHDAQCAEGLLLWRDSSSLINDELYRGYYQGNNENKTNEIAAAYDFLNSDQSKFDLIISYNSTYKDDAESVQEPPRLLCVPRLINTASNAYLQLRGSGMKMAFDFVKEMPTAARRTQPFDISTILGQLLFVWTVELLFPVILSNLVYEKQRKLRIMMKMHGLGDGPYWTISYCYFLLLSSVYMLCFVILGSIPGLKFFRLNNYAVQFVFYFAYINLQISFAFLMATYFSHVRTATLTGYFYISGAGLLGEFLFRPFVEDTSLSRSWITLMELFPAFSLYRIIYEFSQSAFLGNYMGTSGMEWEDLNDPKNGMATVLTIMVLEWFLFLLVAYYLDQFGSFGDGIRKAARFFRSRFETKQFQPSSRPTMELQEFKALIEAEKADVAREREIVEQLLQESRASNSYSVICDNLKKAYCGRDGNPKKIAVTGLSLALPRGQCFGILGPNGAGKTTLINMLTGFAKPTSGTAYIEGMDIRLDMDQIYTGIGVCPQHDLLWDTLTGREHLMFYGRLKNLKRAALTEAIEQSLKKLNLFVGGVADKRVGKYSGGMKRRLSVAISLIGDPKVVYMDEPSSGLDPASRKDLWNAVKCAKQDRAIILTTHSMEEAEVLCDRLGIFAKGTLQCIGNPKELKAKYGGSYVLTITAAAGEEQEAEKLVRSLLPVVNKIYHISGTQKFEIPKQEVRISAVFEAMDKAKGRFTILAWGLADTTLEDVFIKVARENDTSSA